MRRNKGTEYGSGRSIDATNTSALDTDMIAGEDDLTATSEFDVNSSTPPAMGSTDLNNDAPGAVAQVTDQVKDTAKQAIDQGQQAAGQVLDKAKDTVKSQLSSQKEKAVSTLGSFTDALHQTGSQLRNSGQGVFGGYADSLANQIDRAVTYLRDNDVDDLTAQVEGFARKQPALFVGGSFVIGVALARFLKSSASAPVTGMNGGYNPGSTANLPLPTPASAGALTTTSMGMGTGTMGGSDFDDFGSADSSTVNRDEGRMSQFSDDAIPDNAPVTGHDYVPGVGVSGTESGSGSGSTSGSSNI